MGGRQGGAKLFYNRREKEDEKKERGVTVLCYEI